jgi:hypothetical protein
MEDSKVVCTPDNTPPVGINMTGGSISENEANAETAAFVAVDEDEDDKHTFELLEGKNVFQINGNILLTRKGLDYEVSSWRPFALFFHVSGFISCFHSLQLYLWPCFPPSR